MPSHAETTVSAPDRRRRWPVRLAIVLVSLVGGLLLAEITIRIVYGDRYAARPAFMVADPETVFRPAADLHDVFHGPDYQIRVDTDDFGCRLGKLGPVPQGADVVLLCGDSHTFSWGVSTAETMASQLDERIAERTHDAVRVVNLGVSGYSTLQTARRLRQWLRTHADAHVLAAVMIHCQNDPSDNAMPDRLAVMAGAAGVIDLGQPGHANASPSHLVNMLRRVLDPPSPPAAGAEAKRTIGAIANADAIADPDVDALWTYQIRIDVKTLPAQVTVGHTPVRFADLTEESTREDLTALRHAFTPVQEALLTEAISEIHDASRRRGFPVYHTFVRTSGTWFVDAIDAIATSPTCAGAQIELLGPLPAELTFQGPIHNAHSGGHFNPRFNRDWADALFQALLPVLDGRSG